jgi:hypothetical protein
MPVSGWATDSPQSADPVSRSCRELECPRSLDLSERGQHLRLTEGPEGRSTGEGTAEHAHDDVAGQPPLAGAVSFSRRLILSPVRIAITCSACRCATRSCVRSAARPWRCNRSCCRMASGRTCRSGYPARPARRTTSREGKPRGGRPHSSYRTRGANTLVRGMHRQGFPSSATRPEGRDRAATGILGVDSDSPLHRQRYRRPQRSGAHRNRK